MFSTVRFLILILLRQENSKSVFLHTEMRFKWFVKILKHLFSWKISKISDILIIYV